MNYGDFLQTHDVAGRGFAPGEFVVPGSRRHGAPPARFWDNILLTIDVAADLRSELAAFPWFRGLRIAAAYRSEGGAPHSAHKSNRALDLDLLVHGGGPTGRQKEAYYAAAVTVWMRWRAAGVIAGLGLYCMPLRVGGVRVHLDTNHGTRTWQYWGAYRRSWRVGQAWQSPPAAIAIANRLGL